MKLKTGKFNIRKTHFKIPEWIKKIGYFYPDGKFSYEIKKCIVGAGTNDEQMGYPGCTAGLVCPYVGNWRYDSDGEKIVSALGRCQNECVNPKIRQAIAAWVTLHPDIY